MATLKIFSGEKNEKYRYKLTVFFICLVISAFIWMLIKLSGQYSSEITIPVTYSEIPEGKILVNRVDTTIRIGITDRGFSLAWIKYFKRTEPLTIDLKDYRLRQHMHQYEALVGTNAWTQQFLNKYDLSGGVDYILPDTIAFYFEDRYSKEVPVEPDMDIRFAKQYFAYDSMEIDPPTVTISGLYKNISKITEVTTEHMKFSSLSSSIDETVRLKKPITSPEVRVEPEKINIKLHVEKFTESQIEVPISRINEPGGFRVKIFPDKAVVTYLVALKDYKKVSSEMFSCRVDLGKIDTTMSSKLEVSMSSAPNYIRIVSIEPPEVDYLVLK